MSYMKLCAVIMVSLQSVTARTCESQIESKMARPQNLKHIITDLPAQMPRPRNRCCPYDFDSSLCRVVDDRVLCGYNLNVGHPKSKDNRVDLTGGCRLRGGRLECGYESPPFTNSRRPPVWNEQPAETQEEFISGPIQDKGGESEEGPDVREKLKYIVNLTTKKHRGAVTRCIEIRERIVCKDM